MAPRSNSRDKDRHPNQSQSDTQISLAFKRPATQHQDVAELNKFREQLGVEELGKEDLTRHLVANMPGKDGEPDLPKNTRASGVALTVVAVVLGLRAECLENETSAAPGEGGLVKRAAPDLVLLQSGTRWWELVRPLAWKRNPPEFFPICRIFISDVKTLSRRDGTWC